MAKAQKEAEVEYESDLDDAPLPAARRRAAASDDEEEEEEEGDGSERGSPPPSSTVFDSESEPDGQGDAELYDGGGGEGVYGTDDDECDDLFEEGEAEAVGGGGGGEIQVVISEVAVAPEDEGKYEEDEAGVEREKEGVVKGEEEEVKKGSEPYAEPTAGAFYQHDTRFRVPEDDGCWHQRQTFGGQKIWNPTEEAVWVHDRFNDTTFHDNSKRDYDVNAQCHLYDGNVKGYNDEQNVYRERSSRTYQSHRTTSGISSAQNNRSQNAEVWSSASVGKHSSQTRNLQHEQSLPCNQTFGSNTSSASPPFYYSRSSHKEFPLFQREKACHVKFNRLFSSAVHKASLQHGQTLPCKQTFGSNSSAPPTFYSSRSSHQGLPFIQREKARRVTFNKLFSSAVHKAHNSLTPQPCPIFQRKAIVPSASIKHGTAVDSYCIVPIDTMPCSALHPVSTSHNYSKDSKFWDQDRDLNLSEIARPSNEPQIAVYQQRSVQPPVLPMPRASAQILVQKDTITKNIQSHPQTTLTSVSDDEEATAPPETNSSVVLSAVTVQDDMKEAERSCFLDGGSLVFGDTRARSSTLDELGSTGTPAKLPVMLFSGLHPMGSGFPSVAMVLPGFVGQQCDGNSEIGLTTWLPILTDANGVREGTSSPPNFGSNCPQPSEFASSLASPRDRGATNDLISLTPQEIPEAVNHELVHHRNRTRRYSEMSFAL